MTQNLVNMAGASDFLGDPEDLDSIFEDMNNLQPKKRSSKKESYSKSKNEQFSIKDVGYAWRISGVEYKDRVITADLYYNSILENGSDPVRTYPQWLEYSIEAKNNGDFYAESLPFYHSLFRTLYKNRNSSENQLNYYVQEIRSFLKEQLLSVNYNIGTLTKIDYGLNQDFLGKSTLIKDLNIPRIYKDLFGFSDKSEIDKIYYWLTNEHIYLDRVNYIDSSKNIITTIAFSSTPFFRLNCAQSLDKDFAVFGVREVKE